MPTIPIRSSSSKGGIIWDTPPNELPPNAWSRGFNARFFKNRLERVGGYRETATVVDGRALWGIWRSGQRQLLLITATTMTISSDGVTFGTIVTPTVMTDADDWIVTQYGDWVILTSILAEPLVLSPIGTLFVPFANWPATYRAHKITPFKQFLIAIGVEISGVEQGGLVKWSDTVESATLSDVVWDPALTNLAGENTLPSADGLIKDFGVLRDTGIIYNDNSVWRMDPSGSRPEGVAQVWTFRQIFLDDGIIDERNHVEVEGFHYVIGRHDIYKHDGHQRVTIADDRVTEEFYEVLGDTGSPQTFVEHFIEKQEILFIFSRKGETYASEAFIYSYLYDAWTALSISTEQGGAKGAFSHITRGPSIDSAAPTYDNIVGDYDAYNNTSYADLFRHQDQLELYGLAPDLGQVLIFNQSPDNADFLPVMFLERIDYDLDEFFETTRTLKYWSRTIPLITGNGTVKLQFGGRDVLSGSVQWGPEIPYIVGTDYKVDHRVTHRYPAIRLIMEDPGGTISMTGADIEVASSHGR